MERPLLSLFELIAPAAFYLAFVLTFRPTRSRLGTAAILYAIGIMVYPSMYVYSAFSQGATLTNGGVPLFERLWPLLFLCFAIATAIFLWPAIPRETAFKGGVALFVVAAPVLVFLRMLQYHQFRQHMWPLDLTWVIYALLWFRIHERCGKEEVSC